MKCPNCRATVPKTWKTCRCGHILVSGDNLDSQSRSKSTKPMRPVSKPVYRKKDVVEEYREQMMKEMSNEKTRILPVEDLVDELKQKEGTPTEKEEVSKEKESSGTQDVPDSVTAELSGESRKLSFHGNAGTLFGIHILNVFLTVITFGLYYFWGKIKVRRYVYSQSEFEGDRFEFHGTGRELMIGFFKASLLIIIVLFGAELGKQLYPGIYSEIAGGFAIYLLILVLTPMALVLTQRYRFSRTSWRNIRFSFRGGVKPFLKIYIPGLIFTTLTLGIYYYFLHHKTRQYLVNNAYFGDTKFEYDGEIGVLFGKFIKALILSLFTFGIYWFWFAAERHNYYWSHTKFANARFKLDMKGFDFFKLKIVDFILILFTFGLAYPLVIIRDIRFHYDHLTLDGNLGLENIVQDAKSPSALGEEVADILDLDLVGMDLGI